MESFKDNFLLHQKKIILYSKVSLKTVSESNLQENRFVAAKRHKEQKQIIKDSFKGKTPIIVFPIEVHLIRIAPRKLDEPDNLGSSLKWVKDAVAEYLFPGLPPGRADDQPGVKYFFHQTKGQPKEYALEIFFLRPDTELYPT